MTNTDARKHSTELENFYFFLGSPKIFYFQKGKFLYGRKLFFLAFHQILVIFVENRDVGVLQAEAVDSKEREVRDKKLMEQGVQVEEPPEQEKLEQIFVHEADAPGLEAFVVAELQVLQLAFVLVRRRFFFVVRVIRHPDHSFDHEHDDVVCIPRVEAPQTVSDVSRHGFKVFGRKLQGGH